MLTAEFGGIDAIAIDFDGVLANSRAAHDKARLHAFVEMGARLEDPRFREIDAEIHLEAHLHGSHPTEIIGWILKTAGVVTDFSDEIVTQTVALKKEIYNHAVAKGLYEIPGAARFVDKVLDASRDNVTIVTTAHRDSEVRPFLKRYELNDRFPDSRIVSYEDVGPAHLKPDRMGYLLALGSFNMRVRPHRMLAIEDTPNGIEAANKVGATVVGITTTYSIEELESSPPEQRPTFIVRDFKHLSEMCGLDT